MGDAIVLQDTLGADWWRKLDVMAGSEDALKPYMERVPSCATVHAEPDELRIHHLRAAWPVRELISLPVPLGFWFMVAWWIGDDKVSQAMDEAGNVFYEKYLVPPAYAFIKQIPAKADEFVEVNGITLIRANWVPDGFVAITRGGMQKLDKSW